MEYDLANEILGSFFYIFCCYFLAIINACSMEDYYADHEVDVFAENDPDFEIDEATLDALDDEEPTVIM
jgi:hypothetical protein